MAQSNKNRNPGLRRSTSLAPDTPPPTVSESHHNPVDLLMSKLSSDMDKMCISSNLSRMDLIKNFENYVTKLISSHEEQHHVTIDLNHFIEILKEAPFIKLSLNNYHDLRITTEPIIIIDETENVEVMTGRGRITLHSHIGKNSVTGGGIFTDDCIFLRQSEISVNFSFFNYIMHLIRTSLNSMVYDVENGYFRIESFLSMAPSTFAHGQVYHAEAFLSESLPVFCTYY